MTPYQKVSRSVIPFDNPEYPKVLLPVIIKGYMQRQQSAGADLAHLKPPHINPSDSMIDCLINGSVKTEVSTKQERQPEIIHTQ